MNPLLPHSQAPAISIISAMITPAILILASGSLVASTLVRLGRIVDRARSLIDRLDACKAAGDDKGVAVYRTILNDYRHRATLVERALSGYYAAIGFFVAASLTIALDNFINLIMPWLAVAITMVGATLLLAGTVALRLETNMAAGTLKREMELAEVGRDRGGRA
jgi:hypothetical protein